MITYITKVRVWLPASMGILVLSYRYWLPSLLYTLLPEATATYLLLQAYQWMVLTNVHLLLGYGLLGFVVWQFVRNPRGRGYNLESQKKYAEAIEAYTEAIRQAPDDPHSYYHRGNCHYQLGDCQVAIADYDIALSLQTDARVAGNAYLARAKAHHQLADHEQALRDCTQAVTVTPQLAAGHLLRGTLLAEQGQNAAAAADYRVAINLLRGEAAVEGYLRLGRLYHDWGKYAEAVQVYLEGDKPYDHTKTRVRLLLERIRSRQSLKDWPGFIDDCTELLKIEPPVYSMFSYRAHGFHQVGNYQAAIADYTSALNLMDQAATDDKPADVDKRSSLFLNRGVAFEAQGDSAAALLDFEQSIQLTPQNALAYAKKGLALSHTDRWREVYTTCQEAVRLDPSLFLCWLELANAARRLGDELVWKDAIGHAYELINESDVNPYNRACLESVADNVEQALLDLQESTTHAVWDAAWAKRDPDLEWIRHDPRFAEILAGGQPFQS